MKKILVAMLILSAILFTSCLRAADSSQYAKTTKVIEVNQITDTVVCEDYNGNQWEFTECEDWEVGDIATLLMNDNGTENIYDDTIVEARYSGTFEGWN